MIHVAVPIHTPLRLSQVLLFGLVAVLFFAMSNPSPAMAAGQPKEIAQALNKAGANRAELQLALKRVPANQREGMQFLIANMPDSDLKTLSFTERIRSAGRKVAHAVWWLLR